MACFVFYQGDPIMWPLRTKDFQIYIVYFSQREKKSKEIKYTKVNI